MLGRIVIIGVLITALTGCVTTESSADSPGGDLDAELELDLTATLVSAAAQESAPAPKPTLVSESAPAPDPTREPAAAPIPIDNSGLPLSEVMPPREGLRLVFDVALPSGELDNGDEPGGTGQDIPRELALVLQPSRSARADISIHAPGDEDYLVMEETDTLWRTASSAADTLLTRALSRFAYPRFLPAPNQPFRSTGSDPGFLARAVEGGSWEISYDSGATVRIGEFEVEPMAQEGGGPERIGVSTSTGDTVLLTLRSAAVYREREITGAVVSPFGRPLSGVTVAPHPGVGRLPASRVAETNSFGAFTLPFRAAPGDSIRLFYGRTSGTGTEERITAPQEIRGRLGSPDFATLIFTEQ